MIELVSKNGREHLPTFIALMFMLISGCISNPINAHTAKKYFEYGVQAADTGDWDLARQNFARAHVNAQIGHLGPETEAQCIYEWSRVTGYMGKYADAEKGFNEVLVLIDRAHGKADALLAPTLCELARLFHDTRQHSKAISIFERAVSELEKTLIKEDDPIAFADFLEEYASSLRALGEDTRANELIHRVGSIRDENKGRTAKFIAKRYK